MWNVEARAANDTSLLQQRHLRQQWCQKEEEEGGVPSAVVAVSVGAAEAAEAAAAAAAAAAVCQCCYSPTATGTTTISGIRDLEPP